MIVFAIQGRRHEFQSGGANNSLNSNILNSVTAF